MPDSLCVVINMEYITTRVKAQVLILEGEAHQGF